MRPASIPNREAGVELVRRVAREWRTYLTPHATFLSLADSELRDDVQAALAQ